MNEKHRRGIRKISDQFVRDVKSKKFHYPRIDVLIPYNLFRGMRMYHKPGTEYATEDGVYWTKKERMYRTYEKQVPLHIYHRMIGGLFYFLGKTMGKRITVTYRK